MDQELDLPIAQCPLQSFNTGPDIDNLHLWVPPLESRYKTDCWEERIMDCQQDSPKDNTNISDSQTKQNKCQNNTQNIYQYVLQNTGVLIQQSDAFDRMSGLLDFQTQQPKEPIEPETDQKQQIITYNAQLIKKKKRTKIKGKSRYCDIFMPRFKRRILQTMKKEYPQLNLRLKDFKDLPGMLRPNMDGMIDALKIKKLFGVEINAKEIASQLTQSNQILLDSIFPLTKKSGKFRNQKLQKKSEEDFNRFLASYEMITKFVDYQEIPRQVLTFQNCRHYNVVSSTKYEPFSMD